MCVSQLKQLAEAARFYTFGICLRRRLQRAVLSTTTKNVEIPWLRPQSGAPATAAVALRAVGSGRASSRGDAGAHAEPQESPKSQSQVDQEWLQKIKEKQRFDKALDIGCAEARDHRAVDLTSSSMLFAHGDFRRQAENILLDLLGRGGEAALTRGAKLFAKCDLDRDGGLNGEEVLAMTAALQEDVGGREAITPPSVNFNDIDQATTAALEQFREDGVDRLHELSLLRLLVPPPQARSKASTTFTVRSVAAAAASRARGGAAGRELAARQAVEEELLADRQRVRAACGGVVVVGSSSGSIGPLPLLTFLDAFLTLTTELGLHQASVEALAAAHRNRMDEAKRVLEEAERRAREEREGEAARVAERVRSRRSMQLEEEARGR